MKILIIPDVHGRKFWREPCEDMSQWDKVIFLGDYVDPYEGEATPEDVLTEIKDIIALKEVYKDKVILLWGNHDLFYWSVPYRNFLSYWSRHDYKNHNEIESIFMQARELFQFAYQDGKFLFTHAGVNNGFAKFVADKCQKVTADNLNELLIDKQALLAMVSFYRGGGCEYGSPVWADLREHYGKTPNKFIADYYQIFGHTYAKTYVKTKYFAMLDMGGQWFYLEDDELKDKNGNELKLFES